MDKINMDFLLTPNVTNKEWTSYVSHQKDNVDAGENMTLSTVDAGYSIKNGSWSRGTLSLHQYCPHVTTVGHDNDSNFICDPNYLLPPALSTDWHNHYKEAAVI